MGTKPETANKPSDSDVKMKRVFSQGSGRPKSRNIWDVLGDDADVGSRGDLGRSFARATSPDARRHVTEDAQELEAVASSPAAVPPEAPAPDHAPSAPEPRPTTLAPTGTGTTSHGFERVDEDVVMLPLELLRTNKLLQPRLRLNEDHIQSLRTSIQAFGQNDPIWVRVIGDGYFEIIAGHHREEAIRLLDHRKIKAKLFNTSLDEARKLSVMSNEIGLDTTDYEKALAFNRLLEDKVVASHQEIADLVGFSRPRVSQCLTFIHLPGEVKQVLDTHPELFGYRTAVALRDLMKAHVEGKTLPEEVIVEAMRAGVQRLVDQDDAHPNHLISWIQQRLSGRPAGTATRRERVVTDAEGRAAFKTHDKETAKKVHMIVVEWEKKHPFPPEAVQSALVRVLQEMAKSASPEPNSDAEQ
jgi:ParB/RepB/Spo0J family partition protein